MRIHFIGVGGVAMGNMAAMAKKAGHEVSGSDRALYPPMSDRLKDWGIEAREFSEENVGKADLYVIGNAISRGNPEVEKILNLGLPYESMAGALKRFFLNDKDVIVVAGTHGKTTTTFLVDHILSENGEKPGLIVGGVRGDGMEGFRISDSRHFVIEGDEYDTAFFDKHPKFLHYRPRHLILTSIEFDHADIYRDLFDYDRSFQRLLRLIPSEGSVTACATDSGVRRVMEGYQFSPVQWYGKTEDGGKSTKAKSRKTKGGQGKLPADSSGFIREGRKVTFDGIGTIENFPLIGDHNTSNALAAALVALRIGIPAEGIRKALASFPGVLRRQQIRMELDASEKFGPLTFMEDFAHHPTAVKETIAAVADAYPERAIHVLFEPRSATSHRNIFQKEYGKSFNRASHLYMTEVFDLHKVDRKEKLDVKGLIKVLDDRLSKKKGGAVYGASPDKLLEKFAKKFRRSKKGDVVLVLSNGAFGGIYRKLEVFFHRIQNK